MENEDIIQETALRDILEIKVTEKITPFELGRLLLIIDYLYRLSFLFFATERQFQASLKSSYFFTRKEFREKYLEPPYEALLLHGLERNFLFENFDISNVFHLKLITKELPVFELKISGININSPGKIDLLGIGEIFKHIKQFIIEVLKFKDDRKERNLEFKKLEEEIMKQRLENVEKFLRITKEYNLDITSVNKITCQLCEFEEELYQMTINQKLEEIKIKGT